MQTTQPLVNVKEILTKQKLKAIQLRQEPISNRKSRLKKLENWIINHRVEIQEAHFKDFQKGADEVDLSEIHPALHEIRTAIRNINKWSKPSRRFRALLYLTSSAQVINEPKGSILILSPWNYPFNLSISPLALALASGNTVCLKPSEYTPHVSQLMSDMCAELFEEDLCTVVQGGKEASQELLALPFDHFYFTGSPAVGKIVMEAAAKHLASITLELGGKSPVIIDETANITDAAEKIAWGKWLNAGQTCIAPDYVFINNKVKEEFIDKLSHFAQKLYTNERDFTGLIHDRHYKRINRLIMDGIEKGAKVAFEMKFEKEGKIGPIVLTDVSKDCQLMEEEIFGPVLPLMAYNQLEEVVDFVNDRPKPLALYMFTTKSSNKRKILTETTAGTSIINDNVIQFSYTGLPFGGVNNSGIGKGHGHAGFMEFTNQKSVIYQRAGWTSTKMIYPPYNAFNRKILSLILKYL